MEEWCEQVYYFPGQTRSAGAGIMVSCGIHGDETGPIDACAALLHRLRKHRVQLPRPLLLIFGNPAAIAHRQRFVDFNLNRLFGAAQVGSPREDSIEARRARQLEQACARFAQQCQGIDWHLDLHSTIKPSLIQRFALLPVTRREYRRPWAAALGQAGVGALVRQTQRAHTFSQFSHDRFDADSFTLECGSHATDKSTDTALAQWLQGLVEASTGAVGDVARLPEYPMVEHQMTEHQMTEYRVAEAIVRRTEQFRFLIEESEPNFSEHPAGTAFYCDGVEPGEGVFRLPGPRYSLFLNSQVALGQRAGLLLERLQ
ncbi:succinylglutamate desuccinylase [Ketobacter sp.]|uniref:succinylglutamate desuccinylase n=1 Tax=Ketobacter sp. TaxID=2083498 RepID=UPI0025C21346|nr:succinylglutamate desuccinylase [Ketobacter sp.]